MVNVEKLLNDEIMAIIPIYIDMYGNCTKVITLKTQEDYIFKSIKTVLKNIAKFYTLDLMASREYYGKMIGISNIVPIPFDSENIFIPLKVRKPIFKNDGSFGYFNLKFINDIKEEKNEVYIILKGNVKVRINQTLKTAYKHVRHGEIVKRVYDKKTYGLIKESSHDFYNEYNKPATKGDIVFLVNQLMDILKKLHERRNTIHQ
ncbi:hypothetical protein TR13x_10200 [Caloranaerobacter sp. TR13]|uniref:hypothetical protein n=1 Tax=Caloranaerobacter sp. TR13 TaxID=1302151 RepID=UPI0006D3AC35|nr:hypothetical protein [Caloranaerobacter sp. TR13]KPU26440.1 hypothetical protein TR13x_10200 [Caloranaerobacter sp. TR13]